MKRSEMLLLIANQLDFLNGTFEGFRSNFTDSELSKADVILTTIEHSGMLPPYNPIGSEPLEGHIMYCQWDNEEALDE